MVLMCIIVLASSLSFHLAMSLICLLHSRQQMGVAILDVALAPVPTDQVPLWSL